MLRLLLSFALLVLSTCGYAREYILQGKIGNFPVVMSISCDSSQCSGVYFYESAQRDISLVGVMKGNRCMLAHVIPDFQTSKDDTIELFSLEIDESGCFKGSWHKELKEYSVTLAPMIPDEIKHPFAPLPVVQEQRNNDLYEYKRTSLFSFVTDSTVVNGQYRLEYYHIDKTPIYSFRIVAGAGNSAAQKINDILANEAIGAAIEYCSCTSPFGDGEYLYHLQATYLTATIISLAYTVAYDCGGVHPDEETRALNINAQNGAAIRLEDVLHLAKQHEPEENPDARDGTRSDVYVQKLMALLSSLFPKKMVANGECDYTDATYWAYSIWYFTPAGLRLVPSFPHVVAPCRYPQWSVIPYHIVKEYLNPASKIQLP